MTRAEKHAQNVDRYQALRKANLCVTCKGEPLPGRPRCASCSAKSGKRVSPMTDEGRAKLAKGMRTLREERIERGECPRCGVRVRGRRKNCRRCLRRQAEYDSRKFAAHRRCSFCHDTGHNRLSCEKRERAEHEAMVIEAAGARHAA